MNIDDANSCKYSGTDPADPYFQAQFEYDQARRGMEKYDDHLFRIRQWNISLTAAALTAILGFVDANVEAAAANGDRASFSPSITLFVFTMISCTFWLLDGLNKSLQTIHIHNSRDIELFLRGVVKDYVGPTISLRFHRKQKRHYVATVKNLTDESVIYFYVLPIMVFWLAIILRFFPEQEQHLWQRFDASRAAAVGSLLMVSLILVKSWLWRNGPRRKGTLGVRWKFFLRAYAWRRRDAYEEMHMALNGAPACECHDIGEVCRCEHEFSEKQIAPFRADFYNPANQALIFIDRIKLARAPSYRWQREVFLKDRGYRPLYIRWERRRTIRPTTWFKPWRPIIDQAILEEFCMLPAPDTAPQKQGADL